MLRRVLNQRLFFRSSSPGDHLLLSVHCLLSQAGTYCSQKNAHVLTSSYPDVTLPDRNFCEFLLQNASKFHGKVAVIDGETDARVTYGDLLSSRKSIASGLTKLGLKPDDRVTVCMRNSAEFVMTLLGVLSANLVFSSVNPACTDEELLRQVKSSESHTIIIDQRCVDEGLLSAEAAALVKKVIVVNPNPKTPMSGAFSFDSLLHDNGSAFDDSQVAPGTTTNGNRWRNRMALLPYSSGTTGLPKGVMLSHGNMVANYLQTHAIMGSSATSSDVLLGLLPLYHLYCLGVILPRALVKGGTFVSLSKFDHECFVDQIAKYKMTTLHLVPPLIHFLVNNPKIQSLDLSSVKEIFSAAAPLDVHQETRLKEIMKKHNPIVDVCQGYGLTETSPLITFMPLPQDRRPGKEGSVGVLAPNQEVKVVCPDTHKVCGPMERGELWCKGPHVMLGYWRNKKATDECLTQDGWLQTGDIAYYDNEHYFYIVDRLKEFIKYNAYQVAPAELEAILRNHPQVADCAVVGWPDPEHGELPTAFVVPRHKVQGTSENSIKKELYDYVKEHVAHYKRLRGGIFFVESIPKSPSGKILRRNLRATLPKAEKKI